MDENMRPTGVLAWRDLAESHLVEPVASALGLGSFVDRDRRNGGWGIHDSLTIDSKNIHWRFTEVKRNLSANDLAEWSAEHDKAYAEELRSALRVDIPFAELKTRLNQMLHGDLVEKIRNWHARNPKHGLHTHVVQKIGLRSEPDAKAA